VQWKSTGSQPTMRSPRPQLVQQPAQRFAQYPNCAVAPGASVAFQLTPDAVRLDPDCCHTAFHSV
jgi:hypothetical protein